ncbi:MAG: cofactor-independent phosphoglycerate mutase [Syntrophales bacterium]|jgi:2,3-bisphosphoglycerate-independent phosphoglycerate mutase|nr:cofactor-independent phosphoglycerate mutase [Syntrophales bacterium]
MKYIVLLGDGMGDYPLTELGDQTPLEYARTPNMDLMAREGTIGLIDTIPEGFTPGSDVANLSVLGYDPHEYYSGRAPLEAASMGIHLGSDDVAFRCNLVTLTDGPDARMDDFTADHISSAEAKALILELQAELGNETFRFYPGVGYRHLLVWRGGDPSSKTTPPHDITGKKTAPHLPVGSTSDVLIDFMERAKPVLRNHPVNRNRLSRGRKAANAIWLWGQGKAPAMAPLTETYHIRGGVISAVDLLNGIGVYAGLEVLRVEGATGYIDTNYRGKGEKALECLQERDFVFVHVEAPDEMGHEGNVQGKVKAIENFDEAVVGTVLNGLNAFDAWRILVLCDHPTPIVRRTHTADPSPFVILSSLGNENRKNGAAYTEREAKNAGILVSPGYRLMNLFIRDWSRFVEA